jgi:hypothetical protein
MELHGNFERLKVRIVALDELQTIRLINWIRATNASPEMAKKPSAAVLEDIAYLKPTLKDDPLLYSETRTFPATKLISKLTSHFRPRFRRR